MEFLFIGLAVGAVVAYFIFARFNKEKSKLKTNEQSLVIMDKIRSVCKFITVEGDFSEVYHYENLKEKYLSLLLGKKKAIVLVNAKAHVGFDLSKVRMNSENEKKTIVLTNFPQPELLTVETDFKYYDKREGWANPFTTSDLTDINRDAKNYIVDKIPQSGLLDQARKEALDTILLMEKIVETIGWKLDYTALTLEDRNQKKIEK
ncbi:MULTISPECIES: DUF4230 domain-containing protein [Salegentibacter]|jgi:hypothetical protein|uniref:DUF4230 domain-containing protein n=1 Tax=Salegentibacter mishustinae TaxID=270918 RepID=A0A0Q9ZI51_9FLAO|nr:MULTISPECIES: DUF4230 domain-containing protein [Salegentibacter]KRG28455.1 hypothetical protein APR42_06660 [Salegentibacter mishustinae]MDX1719742.1 DUF4230 domain-containing protein [Salegentibacter mishustinae]PNW22391.1 hypothetical protein APB85_14425 [Salegentibacter mishustinae]PZX67622.1 uncharacterized protein DUF4230 [Salegentibacter mishustinae]UBZ07477.1 DUF4230 domain-containing protein [Salegentibacter mishustinae]